MDSFMKAVNTKGLEATAHYWIEWYFDFKNDPNNLTDEQRFSMAEPEKAGVDWIRYCEK